MINILISQTPFYNGDGATDTFVYGFRIDDESHLKVYVAGVLKTLTTHYAVSGVGDDLGGTFIFTPGNIPPAGVGNVVAFRDSPETQLLQLTEGRVGMDRLEKRGLDVLLMLIQELLRTFGTPVAKSLVRWDIYTQTLQAEDGTEIILTGLPTVDPAVPGQLWNDAGTVKVSL